MTEQEKQLIHDALLVADLLVSKRQSAEWGVEASIKRQFLESARLVKQANQQAKLEKDIARAQAKLEQLQEEQNRLQQEYYNGKK